MMANPRMDVRMRTIRVRMRSLRNLSDTLEGHSRNVDREHKAMIRCGRFGQQNFSTMTIPRTVELAAELRV